MLDTLGTLERTHTCGELRAENVGEEVVLMGWVAKKRDFGVFTFIDLRDRYGITQVVVSEETDKDAHSKAKNVRGEYVVAVKGEVFKREENAVNKKLATGEIEVHGRDRSRIQVDRRQRRRCGDGPCGRIALSAGREDALVVDITSHGAVTAYFAARSHVHPAIGCHGAAVQINASVLTDSNFISAGQRSAGVNFHDLSGRIPADLHAQSCNVGRNMRDRRRGARVSNDGRPVAIGRGWRLPVRGGVQLAAAGSRPGPVLNDAAGHSLGNRVGFEFGHERRVGSQTQWRALVGIGREVVQSR